MMEYMEGNDEAAWYRALLKLTEQTSEFMQTIAKMPNLFPLVVVAFYIHSVSVSFFIARLCKYKSQHFNMNTSIAHCENSNSSEYLSRSYFHFAK